MKKICYTDLVKYFTRTVEKIIISVLILMMTGILMFAIYKLATHLYDAIFIKGSEYSLEKIIDLFGGFLLVLIGIELLDTIKVYLKSNVIHVEVVILVAIIALARKIIILKVEEYDGIVMIGIGVLILGMTGAYYLIRKAGLMTIMMENDPETDVPENLSPKASPGIPNPILEDEDQDKNKDLLC
jgi:uncharacterized membrane protein (DUF373 family)